MLYLATFLSLLVSLLIVLMDPVPQRQSLDTREGEAYVVGFLNQHQAAKDYLYYWLGTVFPGELTGRNGTYDPKMEAYYNGTPSIAYTPQAQAIALPGGLDMFLPKELVSELHFNSENNTSYLSFQEQPGDNRRELDGSYHSALICLDNSNNLVPCYRYLCSSSGNCNGSLSGSDAGFCASCSILTADDIRQISFRTGVRPHVITYSDTRDPAWWHEKGEPKAVRKQLWRRAMTRRTHASHNCGVLFRAPLNGSDPQYRWINANVGMINKIQPDSSGEVYCIDNGNRCMKLLPSGIQGFLEQMVTETTERVQGQNDLQNDLQDVFFCISEVKNNPYESIAPATYHFDGINSAALGAPFELRSGNWPSLTNKVLRNEDEGGKEYYLPPNATNVTIDDGLPTLDSQITMPFPQNPATDFTLIFVTEGQLERGTILNDPSAPYALYVDAEKLTFSYLDNANDLHTVTLQGATSIKKCIWQLVKKGTTLTVYLNGKPIQTVGPLPAGPKNVTFGQSNGVKLLNVRYYNTALTKNQLDRMRDIDIKRFGMDTLPPIETE